MKDVVVMDKIGAAGIRANIEYYQNLIAKQQAKILEFEKELDRWQRELTTVTTFDSRGCDGLGGLVMPPTLSTQG